MRADYRSSRTVIITCSDALRSGCRSSHQAGLAAVKANCAPDWKDVACLNCWLANSVISVNGWHELFELHSYRCNID
jgi:hypothetical protein